MGRYKKFIYSIYGKVNWRLKSVDQPCVGNSLASSENYLDGISEKS